jgi:predicted sulfurtransferase
VDDDGKSFWVLKIKVRDKIVADGITDPAFQHADQKGKYVVRKTSMADKRSGNGCGRHAQPLRI